MIAFVRRLLLNMAQRLRSPKDQPDYGPAHRHHHDNIPELLEKILWAQRKLHEAQEQIMIDQTVFDAALAATNTAVTNAVAAIAAGNPGTSTPDATVNAFLTGLGASVQKLVAGTPPVASMPAAKIA